MPFGPELISLSQTRHRLDPERGVHLSRDSRGHEVVSAASRSHSREANTSGPLQEWILQHAKDEKAQVQEGRDPR